MFFLPVSYGDKINYGDEYGPIGYLKCSKCGKMSCFALYEGTLQNHIDGIVPAGRKRKSFILQCSECGADFIPHDDKVDEFIELTKKYPAELDFGEVEHEVRSIYNDNTEVYLTPNMAIEKFPELCVKTLAKGKSEKYKDAVREVAVAFIYNKEWPKTKQGKREERRREAKAWIKLAWILFIFVASAISIIAVLSRPRF